ncbi:carbonic anhydrase-like [Watersipora subatra]|uniref:carbonic anhydrase-like n=1 Tax=Watersipora subatra TaxID=2589382 RepID=UPI00355C2430
MPSLVKALVIISSLIASSFGDSGGNWNYDRDDADDGPSSWGKSFHECNENKNSPINFVTKDAAVREPEPWSLTGWDKATLWTLKDKNYTLEFGLEEVDSIVTSGGDLGTYHVEQFHAHWGSTNQVGSEHQLNGKKFPMEVHFVHKRNDFASVTKAAKSGDDDAIAAVGFFFVIQPEDNPALDTMIQGIQQLRTDRSYEKANYQLNALTDFTEASMNGNFYRYYGGLTTPGCNQVVKWTVFETPIGISAAQMQTIRDGVSNSYGTEYYRPVQALGARPVTLYDVNYESSCDGVTCGASATLSSVSLLTIFSFLCKYF